MAVEPQFHFYINGKGFRLSGVPSSLQSFRQPIELTAAGAGSFDDGTPFSKAVQDVFNGGVGLLDFGQGVRTSSLETRIQHFLLLPPKRKYSSALQHPAPSPLALSTASFTTYNGHIWMLAGRHLYEALYVGNDPVWQFRHTFALSVTGVASILAFDYFIHVFDSQGTTQWFQPETNTSGAWGANPGQVQAALVWNGILYVARGNELWYTNGSGAAFGVTPGATPIPAAWTFVGTITVGTHNNPITGLAGFVSSPLGQQQLLISTSSQIYALLPGDITVWFANHETDDPLNGTQMLAFAGDVWMRSDSTLYRILRGGGIVPSGTDRGYGQADCVQGEHVLTAKSSKFFFSVTRPTVKNQCECGCFDEPVEVIWVYDNSAWHYIASVKAGEDSIVGLHYHDGILFAALASDKVLYVALPRFSDNPLKAPDYEYESSGCATTGVFFGDSKTIRKRLSDAYAVVACQPPGTGVTVEYRTTTNYNVECDEACEWLPIQKDACVDQTFFGIQFRISLTTTDKLKTPSVDAVVLRFLSVNPLQRSLVYTFDLLACGHLDVQGLVITGETQAELDCYILGLVGSGVVVNFQDIDGQEFKAVIAGASRRLYNISCDKYDVSWTLSILQVCGVAECT